MHTLQMVTFNKSQVLGYDAAERQFCFGQWKWIAVAFHPLIYSILLDFMSFRIINELIIHMNN